VPQRLRVCYDVVAILDLFYLRRILHHLTNIIQRTDLIFYSICRMRTRAHIYSSFRLSGTESSDERMYGPTRNPIRTRRCTRRLVCDEVKASKRPREERGTKERARKVSPGMVGSTS
jgi:hypothetical protein